MLGLVGACVGADGQEQAEGAPHSCEGSWVHYLSLSGSTIQEGSCEDVVLSGQLVSRVDDYTWLLDSCACEATCEEPDPHEAVFEVTEPGLDLPMVPQCFQIELHRGPDCSLEHVVVRDLLSEGRVTYAMGYVAAAPPGFESLEIEQLEGSTCVDSEAERLRGLGLRVRALDSDAEVVLQPNSVELLSSASGPVEIVLGKAWERSEPGEASVVELSYSLRPL